MANTLNLQRNGAVGFIAWLGLVTNLVQFAYVESSKGPAHASLISKTTRPLPSMSFKIHRSPLASFGIW